MATDDMAVEGAKASAAMILTKFAWISLNPTS